MSQKILLQGLFEIKRWWGLVNRHRTYIRRTDEAWNKNCIIAVVSGTVSPALFSYVTTFVSKFDTGGPDPFLVTNIIAPAISLIPYLCGHGRLRDLR